MKNITVIIYSYNEEKNIKQCIESAKLLSDTIILIDTASIDQTTTIAEELNITTYIHPYTRYVEPVREFGIKQAQTEWVFILDADERITPELAQEIQNAELDAHTSYFKVPRKELFGKKRWLKYGGWWPSHQIRLLRKKDLIRWPDAIHSTPEFTGSGEQLQKSLLHYSKNDYETIVEKTIIFEDIESILLLNAKKSVSTLTFFRKFLGELNRRLIQKIGFLDGRIGIIESIYQAYSKTITYLYLYEKKKSSTL